MSYERSMGADVEQPGAAMEQAAVPLIDVRATDFSAKLNQPFIDWMPFWLGAGAGLFLGWLIFRSGGDAQQQLARVREAAMDRVFGAGPKVR